MTTHYRPVDGVLAEMVDGRTLLIDADARELITLNGVGSVVWRALRTAGSTVDEIAAAVRASCPDAPAPAVRDDVEAFLDELADAGLVDRA
jgi:hypothetical protein